MYADHVLTIPELREALLFFRLHCPSGATLTPYLRPPAKPISWSYRLVYLEIGRAAPFYIRR
jgi:hypothetical protein